MASNANALPPYHQVLADVQRWLADAEIPGVVVGGVAVAILGRPRMTRDLDLVIWAPEKSLRDLVERGAKFGIVERVSDAAAFATHSNVLLMRHGPAGLPIDVSLGGLPFEEDMIRRARTIDFGNFDVRVPRVEDLVVMKVIAGRDKDLADLEGLVAKNPDLDRAYVRRRVKEFAAMLDQPDLPEWLERHLGQPRRRKRS